jgi:uncharacterized Ntn-hydrolase superfamily protein
MTYSIVARDSETGQLGVAVQTFNLATGTWVTWAEGGVGAVATQALAERSYGILGLDLIRGGKTADEALTALLAIDPKGEFRQVSIIDHYGNISTHTGGRCFPEAGSFIGDSFCTQANMMASDTVWDAMAVAYQSADGDLAQRLLVALDAAQGEGGDIRGKQSAALLVVDRERTSIPLVDLRVDHDPHPLAELHRLLRLHRAYTAEYTIVDHAEAGDIETAYQMVRQIGEWAPDEPYLQYLCALHLAGHLDRWEEGVEMLRSLTSTSPVWEEYLRREATVDSFGSPGLGSRLCDALNI